MKNRLFKWITTAFCSAFILSPAQASAHDDHTIDTTATAKGQNVKVNATVKSDEKKVTDLKGQFGFKLIKDAQEGEKQIGDTVRKSIEYGNGVSMSHRFENVEPGKYYVVARYKGKIKHGEEKSSDDIKTRVAVEVTTPSDGGNGDDDKDDGSKDDGKGDNNKNDGNKDNDGNKGNEKKDGKKGENKDVDCSQFPNHEAAQKWFEGKGYSAENDPHDLDRDGDGKACEIGGSGSGDGDKQQYEDGTTPGKGGPMPDTTISQPTSMAVGGSILAIGLSLLVLRRKFCV